MLIKENITWRAENVMGGHQAHLFIPSKRRRNAKNYVFCAILTINFTQIWFKYEFQLKTLNKSGVTLYKK